MFLLQPLSPNTYINNHEGNAFFDLLNARVVRHGLLPTLGLSSGNKVTASWFKLFIAIMNVALPQVVSPPRPRKVKPWIKAFEGKRARRGATTSMEKDTEQMEGLNASSDSSSDREMDEVYSLLTSADDDHGSLPLDLDSYSKDDIEVLLSFGVRSRSGEQGPPTSDVELQAQEKRKQSTVDTKKKFGITDPDDFTPVLILAVLNNDLNSVVSLIESGISVSEQMDLHDHTALHWLARQTDNVGICRALCNAPGVGQAYVNFCAAHSRMTPLMLCAYYRRPQLLKCLLLEFHADPWLKDVNGATALDMASCYVGNEMSVNLLKDAMGIKHRGWKGRMQKKLADTASPKPLVQARLATANPGQPLPSSVENIIHEDDVILQSILDRLNAIPSVYAKYVTHAEETWQEMLRSQDLPDVSEMVGRFMNELQQKKE